MNYADSYNVQAPTDLGCYWLQGPKCLFLIDIAHLIKSSQDAHLF